MFSYNKLINKYIDLISWPCQELSSFYFYFKLPESHLIFNTKNSICCVLFIRPQGGWEGVNPYCQHKKYILRWSNKFFSTKITISCDMRNLMCYARIWGLSLWLISAEELLITWSQKRKYRGAVGYDGHLIHYRCTLLWIYFILCCRTYVIIPIIGSGSDLCDLCPDFFLPYHLGVFLIWHTLTRIISTVNILVMII